ncbi:hypothetical protein ABT332_15465 [Saccharomonospora azurea]|uniref:hypothetical protein n=1 Tax=Saccharomonospora azurea TaxID=40988 RepID=UPI003319BA2F
MTSQPQPSSAPNAVSAGPASDAKAFAAAALLTFTCGMVVLVGYVMIGFFGIILSLIGVVFGLVWWKERHGAMLPRDLTAKSVVSLAVVALVLFGLVLLMV